MPTLIEIDPSVKAIISTGYTDDPVISEFDEYGFKGCITKPYRLEELVETIRDVIGEQ